MENSDPTQAADTRRRPGSIGCNAVGLFLLLIAILAFVIAAWINSPEEAPDPSSTGVPPTAPAGR